MGIFSKFFDHIDSVAYFLVFSSAVRIAVAWFGGKRLVGRVSRLVLYPVKSMSGIESDHLECSTSGAYIGEFGDRHFLVTCGDNHEFVTARTEPKLLLIKPKAENGKLSLVAEGAEPLVITLNEVEAWNKVVDGVVHGTRVVGLDCGEKAGAWIDALLKKPGHHIIYSSQSVEKRSIRNGTVKYAAWTAHVDLQDKMAYQDSSSYHILSQSSVDDLNSHIKTGEKSVSIDAFRPNIIVTGVPPYAEDDWLKIYIGEAEFSPIKLCSRCVMTTMDPKTAKSSNEPLTTLRKYRKLVPSFGDSPCLGVNLILDKPGTIRVGDEIYAIIGQPKLAP